MNKQLAIWGTGSLAERFLSQCATPVNVDYFIDNNRTGEFLGKPILHPDQMSNHAIADIFICSTFVDEILPVCFELGYSTEQLHVVLPRTLEKRTVSEFQKLDTGDYYYLPWLHLKKELEPAFSSDILYPEVYKELVKSVAYVFIASVEGDFAEFGTCSGYSSSLISYAINYYSSNLGAHEKMHQMSGRNIHLFDSFKGFPEATKKGDVDSPHVASGAWGEGTAKGLSSEQLSALCQQFIDEERINIFEGWYKDTLSSINPKSRFAFLHMDCDLYESTIEVLHYLLEHKHLSEGATVLFDNWFCNKASKHFGEQKAWRELKEIFDIEYTNLGQYACVGNKFIIHGYKKR